MNEQRAREILAPIVQRGPELSGYVGGGYVSWQPGQKHAVLVAHTDIGGFDADELEAIAWWMRNKAAK
jgi:hypothetical protein